MNPLPNPLAPALHILPPGLPGTLLELLMAALLLAFLWWWRRRRRRQRTGDSEVLPSPSPQTAGRAGAWFGGRVDEILTGATGDNRFREGSHELAAAVKRRVEELTGLESEVMTVTEISARVQDSELIRLLRELLDLQFGRQPPGQQKLESACRRSKELLVDQRTIEVDGQGPG